MIHALIQSLRPVQWSKNLLLFAGPVFSLHIFHYDYLVLSLTAFGLFCMITGGTYIVNDFFDLAADRRHPEKSRRPLASGALHPVPAGIAAFIFAGGGAALALVLDRGFGLVCVLYICMSMAYSWKLKHVVILDVLLIALGFFIRAIAGTVIIHVDISKWLLVCTIFLSLFLALGKRLKELKDSGTGGAPARAILNQYSAGLLTQLISISASAAVIAYTLYTVDTATVEKFGTMHLVYTVPFVIYGIFRYMYLIHQTDMGENPEIILLTDKPILINILLYIAAVVYILY